MAWRRRGDRLSGGGVVDRTVEVMKRLRQFVFVALAAGVVLGVTSAASAEIDPITKERKP